MQRNGIRLQPAGKKIGQSVTPRAAMMTARMSSNRKLVYGFLEFSASKSFFKRAKADSKAAGWRLVLKRLYL